MEVKDCRRTERFNQGNADFSRYLSYGLVRDDRSYIETWQRRLDRNPPIPKNFGPIGGGLFVSQPFSLTSKFRVRNFRYRSPENPPPHPPGLWFGANLTTPPPVIKCVLRLPQLSCPLPFHLNVYLSIFRMEDLETYQTPLSRSEHRFSTARRATGMLIEFILLIVPDMRARRCRISFLMPYVVPLFVHQGKLGI